MSKKIAILVLNYSGKNLLEKGLNSILNQSYKIFDVFLIDNASTDDSVKFVRNKYPEVKVITNKRNLGFSGGMNLGIKHIINKGYEAIFFLDNDIVLDKNCLLKLSKVLFSRTDIAICTCTIMDWQRERVQVMGGYFLNILTGTNVGYGRGMTKEETKNIQPFEVFVAPGGASIIKTELLKKIGFFDNRFFVYYEDIDLNWRAINYGYKIYNCPQAYVYHLGSATNSRNKNLAVFNMEKNRLFMYFKNLSILSFVSILPILLITRLFINTMLFLKNKDVGMYINRIKGLIYFLTHFLLFIEDRARIQEKRVISDLIFFKKPFIKYSFNEAYRFMFK